MPRISEQTRAKRRDHILASAWGCFSRNGFHATSMDDVIAATGMSSSAVYRYFRSKDELIDATADEGLTLVRDIFVRLLDADPSPSPARTLAVIVDELHHRTEHPDHDLTRIAIQTWSEALRRPPLRERTRVLYAQIREHLAELTHRWRADGHLPPDADADAAAAVVFALMHGLIVCHHFISDHFVSDQPADVLGRGLAALGAGFSDLQSEGRK